MGSRETAILRLVLWLVNTWLREKYRVVSPQDLERVVRDYLAELPKLGVSLVYAQPKVGGEDEQLTDPDSNQQADRVYNVTRTDV